MWSGSASHTVYIHRHQIFCLWMSDWQQVLYKVSHKAISFFPLSKTLNLKILLQRTRRVAFFSSKWPFSTYWNSNDSVAQKGPKYGKTSCAPYLFDVSWTIHKRVTSQQSHMGGTNCGNIYASFSFCFGVQSLLRCSCRDGLSLSYKQSCN